VKLQIRSVFILMYLGQSLAIWPQEPANWLQEPLAMTADVNSASTMSLEIPLLGSQGTVTAWDWLPDSRASDGTSSVNHAVAANSPMAKPRVMDKRYYFLNGMYAGMAVFDVELTQHCISEQKCREANPVMPSSQAGQLSVNFALVAYDAWYSYWLKKHHHKVWWIPPLSGSVVHAAGVATGFEHQ
jgi:hypothetical protein